MMRSTALAILALLWGLVPPLAAAGDIVVLHTNDLHGQLQPTDPPDGRGGAARRATLIRRERRRAQERGDSVLLLDAGDINTGTYESDQARGQLDVAAMNAMGYDAAAVGNHEYDLNEAEQAAFFAAARFPFLSANIRGPRRRLVFPPWVILERGGRRVAVLGLTTADTPTTSSFGRRFPVVFREPRAALERELRRLDGKADLVVVVSHLGGEVALPLAERFAGRVAAWIDGHDHSQARQELPGGAVYVRAGSKGRWLGRLTLRLGPEGSFRGATSEVLPVTPDLPEDPEVAALLPQRPRSPTVAVATAMLAKFGQLGLMGSSALGNLLCDALREGGDVDIAVTNRGGIRRDLPRGPLNEEQLHGVSPFRNLFFRYRLSGSQVRAVFQQAYELGPGSNGFLEVSGASVRLTPEGVRVEVAGEPLRDEATYTLGVSDFLAGGGDGYTVFQAFPEPEVIDRPPSEMLLEHAQRLGTIRPDRTPRLRFETRGGD